MGIKNNWIGIYNFLLSFFFHLFFLQVFFWLSNIFFWGFLINGFGSSKFYLFLDLIPEAVSKKLIIAWASGISPYSIHYFTHPLDWTSTGLQERGGEEGGRVRGKKGRERGGKKREREGGSYIITRTSSVSSYSVHYFTHPLDRTSTGSQDIRNWSGPLFEMFP